jgi:hypothetical protein
MRPRVYGAFLVMLMAARAGAAAFAAAPECADPADAWLLGRWSMEKQRLTIRRDGDRLVWLYEREPGLVTARWGVKATAAAEGTVNAVRGCEIELRGRYIQYGGTPKALGSPMEYTLRLDGDRLAGSGLGWGKERYAVAWRRES